MEATWPAQIRLTERLYTNTTGTLCGVEFKDGVSTGVVSKKDADFVAANYRCVVDLDDGSEWQVGISADYLRSMRSRKTHGPSIQQNLYQGDFEDAGNRRKQTSAIRTAETVQGPRKGQPDGGNDSARQGRSSGDEESPRAGEQAAGNSGLHDQLKIYTQDELLEILRQHTIKGLREIGNPLGVKSNKADELIDRIIKAQNALEAERKASDEGDTEQE